MHISLYCQTTEMHALMASEILERCLKAAPCFIDQKFQHILQSHLTHCLRNSVLEQSLKTSIPHIHKATGKHISQCVFFLIMMEFTEK